MSKFVASIKSRYSHYRRGEGRAVVESQIFLPMNRCGDEILMLVGNFRDYPAIASLKGDSLKFYRGSFRRGKPFKIGGEYYTQSAVQISPKEIKQGLFNIDGDIREGTEGRAIEAILPDGRFIYFNISESMDKPHIYLGDSFYGTSSSSIFLDNGGNLYYFKQRGSERTLYKNREALFSYRGYYGFVADVDGDKIYLIAPTENGSGLYIFDGGELKRGLSGDNIIDMKLISSEEALIATISSSGYSYLISNIEPTISTIPDVEEITFKRNIVDAKDLNIESKEYIPIENLRYSSLNQNFRVDGGETLFNLNINFIDPVGYNSATISIFRDDSKLVGGVGYIDRENIVEFTGELYGADYDSGEDSFGYRLNLNYPITEKGYYSAYLGISYQKEYDSLQRPATLYLNMVDSRVFGISRYPSYLSGMEIFLADDRDNFIYGLNYRRVQQFGEQNFISLNFQSINSDRVSQKGEMGVKLSGSLDGQTQNRLEVEAPNIGRDLYVKSLNSFEVGLYRSFDTPIYNFSLPISLRRTTIYSKYKRFNIDDFSQTTFGVEGDFLLFNNFTLPVKFEYIRTPYGMDESLFRVRVTI